MTEGIERNKAYSAEMRAGVVAARSIAREERAEDIVGTCLFLVSDAASVTGQIVVVDGGATFH